MLLDARVNRALQPAQGFTGRKNSKSPPSSWGAIGYLHNAQKTLFLVYVKSTASGVLYIPKLPYMSIHRNREISVLDNLLDSILRLTQSLRYNTVSGSKKSGAP